MEVPIQSPNFHFCSRCLNDYTPQSQKNKPTWIQVSKLLPSLNSLTKPISTPQNQNPNPKAHRNPHKTPTQSLSSHSILTWYILQSCLKCLLNSISRWFDIEEMGRQLYENRFDIEACCVTMMPSRKKGESLVLPNLKLKVIIEAIRALTAVILYCYILAPQTPKACCNSGAKSKKISSITTL